MHARNPSICLVTALFIVACDRTTPEEQAAQDARDVAMVEAAQKMQPPMRPVSPEPITEPDFARAAEIAKPSDAVSKLPDAEPERPAAAMSCRFRPKPAIGGGPIIAVEAKRALLKLGGELVVLAADHGSRELTRGIHARYIGREYSAVLAAPVLEGGQGGDTLMLRDRYDSVVYAAAGRLDCR